MWFSRFLSLRRSASRRTRSARQRSCYLALEALEDRNLPSFLAPVSYPVGTTPVAVATGDFSGDGKPDLVVANRDNSTISVLMNNGDGTFQAAVSYAAGGSPVSVAVGDINGDGKLDIVTANYLGYYSTGPTGASGSVSVLLGNGDGTFQPAQTTALPLPLPPTPVYGNLSQRPDSVAVGDFNNDGKLDVAVAAGTFTGGGSYAYAQNGYAHVLLGHGDGTFAPAVTTALPSLPSSSPGSLAVGDFDGNHKLDLAIADGNRVTTLLGNGDGSFQTPVQQAAVGAVAVAVADLNGDGRSDLVTANNGSSGGSTSAMLGNGDGSFQTPRTFSTSASSPTSVVVADFNSDGKPDVMTANGNSVNLLLGHGDGTLNAAVTYASGTPAYTIATGDFNGDGSPDLAVAGAWTANTVSVLLNGADWAPASSFTVSGFPSSTTAGVSGSFTVTAKNADGTIDTHYTGTVHFTSSDGQAVLPADYTFTEADGGVHTFSAILKTAGTQSIAVADTFTASLAASESGITVNPAAASTFSVAGFPSPTTAGVAGSFTVTARDAYGNVATGYTGTVRFTSSDGKASLPGNYTFTAGDAGVHTFSAVLKTAGTQSITATDTTTAGISGTDGGITVSPGAASQFIITAPSSVTAGVAFSLTVTVEDAYGNVATGYTGTIHFSSTDSKATLPADYAFTAADAGVHTFSKVTLRTIGYQTIRITDTLDSSLTDSMLVDVLAAKKK